MVPEFLQALLAPLALCSSAAPALQATAPPRLFELEGGARLVLIQDDTDTAVDGLLAVEAGSDDDPPGAGGRATLVAAVLRAEALEQEKGGAPGSIDVQAARRRLRFEFRCEADELEVTLGRLRGLLRSPQYMIKHVEAEGRRQLSATGNKVERRPYEDQLRALLHGPDSPLASQIDPKASMSTSREELLAWHRAHIGPDRIALGLAGDLDPQRARELAGILLEGIAPVGPPPELPSSSRELATNRIFLLDRPDAEKLELYVAAPGVPGEAPDEASLRAWAHTVQSRAQASWRERPEEAPMVSVIQLPSWGHPGVIVTHSTTQRLERVGAELKSMIDGFGHGDIGPGELEAARDVLLQGLEFEMRSRELAMARYVDLALQGLPLNFWVRYGERLGVLDAKSVNRAVKSYIDPKRLLVLAVGPAARISESFARLGEVVPVDERGRRTMSSAGLDRLFSAVGGKEAWRNVEWLEYESVLELRQGSEKEVAVHQWRSLTHELVRIEQTFDGRTYASVINGKKGWLRTPEGVNDLSESQHALLLDRANRSIFRLLHGLARGEVQWENEDERLNLTTKEGLTCTLELSEDGAPARISYHENDATVSYEYHDWREAGGLRYPTRMVQYPLAITTRITSFEPNARLSEQLFQR